ncbi:glycoside hydrolase family 3 N-terminal domain-containing protein [uncultured Bacteroides sp.]|uniref:glycoside hydrolase family 3 N-terminal domain-containing protein n=1 Tax=uncultured Bacteroides sp. TaxID=162156 RepID=UPI0035A60491
MLNGICKLLLLATIVMEGTCAFAQLSAESYKNPRLPVEQRVADLLSRMTLEEKVGQLLCPLGWEMYGIEGEAVFPSDKFKQLIKERHAGMLWATYRADPWTRKTLENGLNPALAAKAGNSLQKYVMENTRLGIPLFLAEEAPHGHMAIGTTVFPTGIGMAATWSPQLINEVGKTIGKEVRLQGGHISYGPVLDLTRDSRWSRVEETFGEDPVLTGTMGKAMVEGLGGGNLSQPYSTLATLKHFLAYGISESGQNGNPSLVGIRELHENFLPPFRRAIDAGALSVMTSYNSMDGIPCTANHYLLTRLLRNEWKFKGFVVSDLYSIEGIHQSHFVAPTMEEAAILALSAGVDVDLGGDAYMNIINAVNTGRISNAVLDASVACVLRLKFEMGLFENPYTDPEKAKKEVRNNAHITLARRVAQASVTLLKNEHSLLPLNKDISRIALVGPNADNRYNMLGDYTAPQEEENVKTVLDGICAKLSPTQVEYVKGCAVRDTTTSNLEQAVAAARRSEVIIAVVGGSSARDFKTSYKETGAAIADEKTVSDMECGEGFDRTTLSLLGKQQELLKALKATGKPLVVVYIEGRPLDKNWASENADALLTAYYPGQEGGNAIADVLFGDYNPAGRLPITVPRSVGQIPIYYNKKAPQKHDYVELSASPLYPFGYGLSYTTFEYSDLYLSAITPHSFEVSFKVRNTGECDGEEVAQLYLRDEYASVVQPLKQLKHFERFYLKRGEMKEVKFILSESDFALIDRDLKTVVEPGTFQIMVGASSDDIRLQTKVEIK